MTGCHRSAAWNAVRAAAVTLCLAGCSAPSWLCLAPPGPRTVTLILAEDANNHAAVALDLLMITDEPAAQRIAALSATDYFNNRTQLERDYKDAMTIRSWELTPGQIARDVPIDAKCHRVRTLLFARYATPGAHRQLLGPAGAIVVSLGAEDFSVAP